MKQIFSLLLATCIAMSVLPVTQATQPNESVGTQVEYVSDAEANRWYTITVPAKMTPKVGQSATGTVILKGQWAANETITVTVEPNVKLTNSINPLDTHTLDVTLTRMSYPGNNTEEIHQTGTVSLSPMTENALFGQWSGTFNYNVTPSFEEVSTGYTFWHEGIDTNDLTTNFSCDGKKIYFQANDTFIQMFGGRDTLVALMPSMTCQYLHNENGSITAVPLTCEIDTETLTLIVDYKGDAIYGIEIGGETAIMCVQKTPIDTNAHVGQKYVLEYTEIDNMPDYIIPYADGTMDLGYGQTVINRKYVDVLFMFVGDMEFIASSDGSTISSFENISNERVTSLYVLESLKDTSTLLEFNTRYETIWSHYISSDEYIFDTFFNRDGTISLKVGNFDWPAEEPLTFTYDWDTITINDAIHGKIVNGGSRIMLYENDVLINILVPEKVATNYSNQNVYTNPEDGSYIQFNGGVAHVNTMTLYAQDGSVIFTSDMVESREQYLLLETERDYRVIVGEWNDDGTVFSLYDFEVPNRNIVGTYTLN